MKNTLAFAAAGLAMAVSAPAAAQDRDYGERSDTAFAELVEGREAGEATTCISVFNSNRLQVIEHVGLAYRRGDTLWVARARNPNALGVWDVPVIERRGSQLCRHDVMTTIDRSTGVFSGVLSLEDFVPWTEVDEG